jgi:hypothetical protein
MACTQRFTDKQIVAALTKTKGMVFLAAKRLGYNPDTIYERAKSCEAIRDAIRHQRGKLIDTAESKSLNRRSSTAVLRTDRRRPAPRLLPALRAAGALESTKRFVSSCSPAVSRVKPVSALSGSMTRSAARRRRLPLCRSVVPADAKEGPSRVPEPLRDEHASRRVQVMATARFISATRQDESLFRPCRRPGELGVGDGESGVAGRGGQKRFRFGSWEAIVRRLAIHRGRVLITTTPYTLGWMKQQLYDRGRRATRTLTSSTSIRPPTRPSRRRSTSARADDAPLAV